MEELGQEIPLEPLMALTHPAKCNFLERKTSAQLSTMGEEMIDVLTPIPIFLPVNPMTGAWQPESMGLQRI